MRLTTLVHHAMPFVAIGAGLLILIRPQLMNYVVAACVAVSSLALPMKSDELAKTSAPSGAGMAIDPLCGRGVRNIAVCGPLSLTKIPARAKHDADRPSGSSTGNAGYTDRTTAGNSSGQSPS
jgi:hypothetical protein